MLLSQKEERSRRFTLALRAGVPILILVFLVFFTTINKTDDIIISLKDGFLLTAITFITIYFIYFLMNLSVQESVLDQTTQGFNKKAFIHKLKHYKPKILACLTIENLQSLNENYSSDQVDTLLYTVSTSLNLIFKQHGLHNVLIGRNRGSEFLIAINENITHIQNILESMTQSNTIMQGMEIEYKFAIITDTSDDFSKNIIQLRDIISSQSVGNKHNKEENTKDAKALSEIENSVINAIHNKNLQLSFRPLLNTHTNIVDTYETAVKLKSLHHTDILPKHFLPIVNRLGLGRDYDYILICNIIDLLPLVDKEVSFTFNLSPFSLRDKAFQHKVFNYIETSNADASRLIIQLYERKTHHDLSTYLETLNAYRAKGIKICIDNFGSSNASMEYMKHFKFDIVQFDRDYVSKLQDSTSLTMLSSLISMSKELNIQTVAKWVDDEKQKDTLTSLGVDYLQGFGIKKPLTENQLIHKYN